MSVPPVPHATPGTEALANQLHRNLVARDASLLANHGAVSAGRSAHAARYRTEIVEHPVRLRSARRLLRW